MGRLKNLGPRIGTIRLGKPFAAGAENRQTAAQRGYGYRWQRARAAFLAEHPLCVMCHAAGHVTPATVVDHIEPHRGDPTLFWSEANWQSLCSNHHSSEKQRMEKGGSDYSTAIGNDGYPVDPRHPWNKE